MSFCASARSLKYVSPVDEYDSRAVESYDLDLGTGASVLAQPLHPDQLKLVKAIWRGRIAAQDWPVWQYVEMRLDQTSDLDAGSVLASLPRVSDSGNRPLGGYGLTWLVDTSGPPAPETRIALSVPGTWHADPASGEVGLFLRVLEVLTWAQRKLVPNPKQRVESVVTREIGRAHV